VSITATGRAASPFIAVLVATKLADAATTYVGLEFASGVHEANPAVAELVATYGVAPALVGVTVAVVCAIAVVTELAVGAVRRYLDAAPDARLVLRLAGYGLPSAVHVAVAARNVIVVAQV
jgi:hypothetical protein